MPNSDWIVDEIRERFAQAKIDLKEVSGDIRTAAFNQELGRHDALGELLEWIEEQRA